MANRPILIIITILCFQTGQFHISMSEPINRLNLNGHVMRQAESNLPLNMTTF